MSFKSIFNKQAVTVIAMQLKMNDKSFDEFSFIKDASKGLNKLELKDRVNHIAHSLVKYLPSNYKRASRVVIKSLAPVNKDAKLSEFEKNKVITGFLIWPFTRYAELAGSSDLETSLELLLELTQRFSSEFAIRHFIDLHPVATYKEISKWKKDKRYHVRRLATEGTRPTLPWGQKVEYITNNLPKNIKLLKGMEKDESEYVRKSVANHLNDISKLDVGLFFSHVDSFKDNCEKSMWVKRHAMRTLLKQSHPKALQTYGYDSKFKVEAILDIKKKSIKEGQSLPICLVIKNTKKNPIKALIEYKVHYMKSNGKLVPKVFRLRDTSIGDQLVINKEISFKRVTTRKHYSGAHKIEIVLNGKSIAIQDFTLKT